MNTHAQLLAANLRRKLPQRKLWPALAGLAYQEAMTDSKPRPTGFNQLLIDLGPIATFVVAYNVLLRLPATKDNAVYIATGVFIAVTLAAIAYSKFRFGRVAPVLLITGVFVTAFGGLSILLRDQTLIQIKVTAVNGFYAAAIAVSLALGYNIWKLLFGHLWTLPDRVWNILALRWAGYFAFMAGMNEVLRATLTFETWVNLRVPLAFVPFFLFFLANAPLVLKHHVEPEDPAPADKTA
jgi:intracellular septation protein